MSSQSDLKLARIEIVRDRHAARITLARPEKRNAFDEAAIVELTAAFRALGDDPAVRVIVLAGQGSAFCAGADLDWMRRMAGFSETENIADAQALSTMLNAIYTCAKPVVARVHGDAHGGGAGLVAAADIAVACESAQFSFSEARLGLLPATISPYVIRAIGERVARRYLVSAERFGAAEALRIGLVHQVADADGLDAVIDGIVAQISANGPNAVTACKQLVRNVAGRPIDATLMDDTAERIARLRASDEGREGILSFLEKRAPGWQT